MGKQIGCLKASSRSQNPRTGFVHSRCTDTSFQQKQRCRVFFSECAPCSSRADTSSSPGSFFQSLIWPLSSCSVRVDISWFVTALITCRRVNFYPLNSEEVHAGGKPRKVRKVTKLCWFLFSLHVVYDTTRCWRGSLFFKREVQKSEKLERKWYWEERRSIKLHYRSCRFISCSLLSSLFYSVCLLENVFLL